MCTNWANNTQTPAPVPITTTGVYSNPTCPGFFKYDGVTVGLNGNEVDFSFQVYNSPVINLNLASIREIAPNGSAVKVVTISQSPVIANCANRILPDGTQVQEINYTISSSFDNSITNVSVQLFENDFNVTTSNCSFLTPTKSLKLSFNSFGWSFENPNNSWVLSLKASFNQKIFQNYSSIRYNRVIGECETYNSLQSDVVNFTFVATFAKYAFVDGIFQEPNPIFYFNPGIHFQKYPFFSLRNFFQKLK